MSKLTVLVGGVGSGKTTFSGRLGGVTVSTDRIRKALYGGESVIFNSEISDMLIKEKGISAEGMSAEECRQLKEALCEEYIFILARRECCRLLKEGHDVVYDSANFKKKYRRQIMLEAEGLYDECEAFVMDVPLEIAIRRNESRERTEPESTVREIHSQLSFPEYSEGFDRIYSVDCNSEIKLIPKNGS